MYYVAKEVGASQEFNGSPHVRRPPTARRAVRGRYR